MAESLQPTQKVASSGAEAFFEGESETPSAPPTPEERQIALITHLGAIFLGWVLPLVVWLVKKDQSRFVADQAKEELNFQITMTIASLVAMVAVLLLVGVVALPLVLLYRVIGSILAGIASNNGKLFRYRYCLRLVK